MNNQRNEPPDQLYQEFGKDLYRLSGNNTNDGIQQMLNSDSSANNSQSVTVSASDLGSGVDTSTSITTTGSQQAGKKTYDNTVSGYILGVDPKDGYAKLYIGNSTNYLNWDGSSLAIIGSISATTITGGTIQTATSGQRIRIVSASAVSPTQSANSLMLINSSDHGILSFGTSIGSNSSILNVIPTDNDQGGLSVQNAVKLTSSPSLAAFDVVDFSGSSAITLSLTNAGSGDTLFVSATGTGKGVEIFKSGSAASAIEITQATNDRGMYIIKSGSGTGTALQIQNSGTSYSIYVANSSTSATQSMFLTNAGDSTRVMEVYQTSNSNANTAAYFSISSSNTTAIPISTSAPLQGTGTHFQKCAAFGSVTIWSSDGTTPNGNLSANSGDFCVGGASGHPYYCTGTTNWTQI